MTLDDKITLAEMTISKVMAAARRPAIMSSFGKDSMVMLEIVRRMEIDLPIVFHREPFLPHKYRFANKVIDQWGLTVYDYAPSQTFVQMEGACVEVLNAYDSGARPMLLPTGISKPGEGERTMCALHDFYLKPTGTFNYPFDFVFVGHKSSDVDPIYGAVPLYSDVANNVGTPSVAFPLRYFTDDDVWEFHERFDVPIHHERYEKVDGKWRERSDKSLNPDYFPACTACMKPNGGNVACPRMGGMVVSNVSDQLRWAPRQRLSYMTESKT